jgi:alpha-D-xyloside xylohydrolase
MWVSTTADSPPHPSTGVSPWAQLQSSYADATGHSPVWPDWTSGFWQCKLRYSNQTQIMAVANEVRDPRRGLLSSLERPTRALRPSCCT